MNLGYGHRWTMSVAIMIENRKNFSLRFKITFYICVCNIDSRSFRNTIIFLRGQDKDHFQTSMLPVVSLNPESLL